MNRLYDVIIIIRKIFKFDQRPRKLKWLNGRLSYTTWFGAVAGKSLDLASTLNCRPNC